MEHDMRRIKSFLMIMTPLLATTAIAGTNQLPMGALDSEEKYAEFWSEVVETDFEIGACAFSLGTIASANSRYTIKAVDTRLGDSEPFRVGEFTMHRQDVAHTFEPVIYSYEDDHLVHILINHMTMMRVEGVVEFYGGETAHLSAYLYISNTENMTTGEVIPELQRAFVPDFVGKDVRSRGDETRQRPELVSSADQDDTDGGNDVEPCNRFWTKCVDWYEHKEDLEACIFIRDVSLEAVREDLGACHEEAEAVYLRCKDSCFNDPQDDICHAHCRVDYLEVRSRCAQKYMAKITEIQIAFRSCLSSVVEDNSWMFPGCDCPEGWVPF